MIKYLIYSLTIILGVYLVFLAFMFFYQRSFMYYPSVNNYNDTEINFDYETVSITTPDNINLKAWYSFNQNKKQTIVFFHGNAGDLENRIYKLNHFKNLNVNFLIVSWRGFSGNDGQPSEKNLYIDANSTIKWLEGKGVKKNQMVLYGESLGTGIAVEVASKSKFAGVILESPFTSMQDMGKKLYPYLPISILQHDKYLSLNKIKKVKSPILIMHGQADNIVPFYMGKKLFDEANDPKVSYFPEEDNHMMEYNEELIKILKNFLSSLSNL